MKRMRSSYPKRTSRRRQSAQTIYGLVALCALLVLGLLAFQWLPWDLYWIWLAVVNVVTFAFFRYDKRQARINGATRVPEVVLLALLLSGGVFGGVVGMLARPRHKTHKSIFWIMLLGATVLHAYLLYLWILS
jgi:uncharacterized membrane protein YsdA (DUF1294 family)